MSSRLTLLALLFALLGWMVGGIVRSVLAGEAPEALAKDQSIGAGKAAGGSGSAGSGGSRKADPARSAIFDALAIERARDAGAAAREAARIAEIVARAKGEPIDKDGGWSKPLPRVKPDGSSGAIRIKPGETPMPGTFVVDVVPAAPPLPIDPNTGPIPPPQDPFDVTVPPSVPPLPPGPGPCCWDGRPPTPGLPPFIEPPGYFPPVTPPPIPEPAAWLMLIVSFALLGIMSRRRSRRQGDLNQG